MEVSLLRYAQQEATRWGAERFAAEFKRRDEEERRLDDPEPHTFIYRLMTGAEDTSGSTSTDGLVDEAVRERVVGSERDEVELKKPKLMRHAHVPRPPASGSADPRRKRMRRRAQPTADAMWMPSAAQLDRMSAAGRRLYGLDDPS